MIGPILSHKAVPMAAKRSIINAIFTPTLCYQSQTWSMNKKTERKITTCEMKCLRRAANKTRRDKIRNEVIRDTIGTKPILQQIEKQRLSWFGHLMRMPPDQPALRSYNSQLSGTKPFGRPRRRWIDGVRSVLHSHNTNTTDATHAVLNRRPAISPRLSPGISGGKK